MTELLSKSLPTGNLSLKEKIYVGLALLSGLGLLSVLLIKFDLTGLMLFLALILVAAISVFIFRNPEFGWYLIIFFLPFERVPTFNLGGVDLKINTIIGFITLCAWILALMFNAKKHKVQPYALAWPLLFFIGAMFLSASQAREVSRSISVLIFILFTVGLSVLTVNMVSTKEKLRKTLLILFLGSLITGLFGLFQFGGDIIGLPGSITLIKEGYSKSMMGFPRIQAFSMEPLYFGNLLLLPIFVGLALFFNKINLFSLERKAPSKIHWGFIGLIVLFLVNLILTVSRGAYLGFGAAFLILLPLFYRKLLTWKNVLTFIAVFIVVGYGVIFALSKGDYQATNIFIEHVLVRDYQKSASVQERLTTYKAALDAYHESPITGVGIGNYGPWLTAYPAAPPPNGWQTVNNEYLEILAETGIVGIITFSLMIIFLIYRSILALKAAKDPFLRAVMVGLFSAFIGVLIQYNFFSTLYIIYIWILIGLLIAVQSLILKEKNIETK